MISKYSTPFVLAALMVPSVAFAQDAASADDAGAIADIVVTAQKRSERLRDIPIAVSALTSEQLKDAQVNDILSVASLAPGLQVSSALGTARVFIRGIGLTNFAAGGESSVAYHVNGVVVARPTAQTTSFYDLERIEVLRGPQGTLYGRNATGGSLNVITKRPTKEFSGYAEVTLGNYSLMTAEGAIGGQILPGLNARLAGRVDRRDGFGKNNVNGGEIDDENINSFRVSLDYVGSDVLGVALTYSRFERNDAGGLFHAIGIGNPLVVPPEIAAGGNFAANTRDLDSEVNIKVRNVIDQASGEVTLNIADDIQIKSLTGYLKQSRFSAGDLNATRVQFLRSDNTDNTKQFTQELQLTWDFNNFKTLFGAYYFHEDIFADTHVQGPVAYTNVLKRPFIVFNGALTSKSYAFFGNVTWNITDQFAFTGGLRYSHDQKDDAGYQQTPTGAVIPLARHGKWSAWTPRFTLEYKPSNRTMIYGTVTRGYKAGVINIGSAGNPVNPEFVWSYEAGVKTDAFDGALSINADVFYTTISDLQVQRPINGTLVTVNAAKATTKGLELEANARLGGGFGFHLNAAYVDAKYDRFDTANSTFAPRVGPAPTNTPIDPVCAVPANTDSRPGCYYNAAGNYLTSAPKYQAETALSYETEFANGWGLRARVQGIYESKKYFNEFNEAIAMQGETFTLNANLRVNLPGDRLYVNFWGRNLTDEYALTFVNVTSRPIGHVRLATLAPPRTFGASLGFKF
ncbi:TonB-dependent receptor [Sphingobium fluviale]|nr:TonB-dependent receptor [Sphingobium fluviale]